jgi:tyrosine aminotransferase
MSAIQSALSDQSSSSLSSAGYANACGTLAARMAIAKHHRAGMTTASAECNKVRNNIDDIGVEVEVTSDDVIIANGVSGALELALTSLLDDDSILLVPRPGFPLYKVITESHGASVMYYNLLPEHGWECDLVGLECLLAQHHHQFHDNNVEDECNHDDDDDDSGRRSRSRSKKTIRGILVNNPSNPTGAVYSFEYLSDIVRLAAKYQIPIISDEIYGDLTFHSRPFYPLANVAASLGYEVPIITASGLGKQYLVPGWRLGWIVYQDNKYGAISNVKKVAQRLAQVILGACHLAQFAIPAVLDPKVTVLQYVWGQDVDRFLKLGNFASTT